ncbi:Protein of unknown function [Halogranum gelatinilyticum]|uniref:Glycosyltransferase 61 catalytic domain-containing protein n=1 Tax=Halogranum gelatinilyticum TaxID=660521 RepID=A0A1G9X9R9_9EURY|nr:glycosyltransferase family 61 protein [Halogranum gelatinilyticum]SDM93073.1 Protein of unknown function [Halogranum gelatinilyticum]
MSIISETIFEIKKNGIISGIKWGSRLLATSLIQPTADILDSYFPFIFIRGEKLKEAFEENGTIYTYGDPYYLNIDGNEEETKTAPDYITSKSGRRKVDQPFVGILHEVHIVGDYPIPIKGRSIIQEAVVSTSHLVLHLGYSLSRLLTGQYSGRKEVDTGVLLFNKWNSGYYHWTTETLTRLISIKKYIEHTNTNLKLIVGPNLTRFQEDTLSLLGFANDQIIRYNVSSMKVNRLIVPSNRRGFDPGDPAPVDYRYLRHQMREIVDVESEGHSSRVYISRQDAPTRQVTNEKEVITMLKSYGFELVTLSENNVQENIRIFSKADVVVAPHGAGLTDIIYSNSLSVIELLKEDDCSAAYYTLSKSLSHDYYSLLCDSDGKNLSVDVAKLEKLVNEVI